MSPLHRTRFVLALFLTIGAGVAHAEKVDWSQYTEPPGYKVPAQPKAAPVARPSRATKAATKKQPSTATPRARAKRKH